MSKSAPTPSPPSLPFKDSPPIPPQLGSERVISEEDFEPVSCYILQITVGRSAEKSDFFKESPNEIIVGKNTNIDDHIARAVGLLNVSPSLVFLLVVYPPPQVFG